MEKLIELLNEYETTLEPNEQIEWTENGVKATPLVIISKKFGFIKWLVENDKIDTDELLGIYWETRQSIWEDNKYELYSEYERLLMLLSLQDEPIKFLLEILK